MTFDLDVSSADVKVDTGFLGQGGVTIKVEVNAYIANLGNRDAHNVRCHQISATVAGQEVKVEAGSLHISTLKPGEEEGEGHLLPLTLKLTRSQGESA